ncbi:thiamine-phosphate kinase [Desulfohalovibrio reitneri]|uniref:thiamine-phosphate kinase n=1 Tax=Desulfohalovibrio reitneri TaxID=1307759 RepID=UPI0004A6EFD9|nr:thiamine-phosphate kinase [Desulfohalovibrio reitneri]
MALASENEFLAMVDDIFPAAHDHMELGRGDDCAVLRCPSRLCLTTDAFLEDVHFRRAYFTPEEAGRKALLVNVSDLAGMGAQPLGFSLDLLIPPGLPDDWWRRALEGMRDVAVEAGMALVGGDLSVAAQVGFCVTAWGGPWAERALARGQARPGDTLFAVGPLGLARAGLLALERMGREDAEADSPEAVCHHLSPPLLLQASRRLSAIPGVRGLMDVSDGLARDVPRFLAPETGALIDLSPDALHPEVRRAAAGAGDKAPLFAYLGGEDYALLGACAPAAREAAQSAGACILGVVTDSPGVILLNEEPAPVRGFDHFEED